MNRNEFAYPNCRGRNRNFRGRGVRAVNVQRPLVAKTAKASTKKATSTNYEFSASSIKWKNHSSTSNNVTHTVTNTSSSRTFNTTDIGSKIVIAVSTGRGEASYEVGIAALDVYKPTLILCEISDTPSYINTLTKINILNPDEILIPLTFVNKSSSNRLVNKIKEHFKNVTITAVARASYNKTCGMVYIKDLCALQWNSIILALQHKYYCLTAASALLNYTESYLYILYSKNSLKVEYQESEGYCIIDVSTADRLELVASNASNTNDKYSSLYGVLNHCYTRIGSRTLRATILQPPCSVPDIEARLDCVTELKRNSDMMIAIQTILPKISNIDQLLSLATLPSEQGDNFSERHLMYVLTLNALLDLVQPLRETFEDSEQPLFKEIISILDNQSFKDLTHVVRSLIQPDARPVKGRQGSIEKCFLIKPGVNGLLDILRKTYSERVEDLREYVRQLRDKYNLPLSLSNNSKKGYHIVLQLNAHTKKSFKKSELPLLFIQVERLYSYVTMKTIELMNLATRIDDILEEIYKMSSIMVYQILIKVRDDIGLFYKLCEVVAKLDMIQSIAQASNAIGYVRPKFGDYLEITNAKHPLLEYLCPTEPTPNNIFATDAHNVHIITGPNGSGKSIFIRQVLLLQVMAQVGCYIPAETAILRVCDRVLARISFDDNLDCGASSFVLEVKEIQYFHTAMTSNTLIIIDEVCRSTAVGEGTALAMAIVESLAKSKAFIFLATHFIFITKLEEFYPNLMNWQMDAIQEEKERVVLRFTYSLISGVTAFKKYGLIAATASWPKDVVEEAERLYAEIEPPKDHAKIESLGVLNRLKYNFEAELKLLKVKKQLTSSILEQKLGEYMENLKEVGLDVAQYLPQNLTFECSSGQNDARRFGDEASGVLYPQVVYSPSQKGEITGYDRFCQELQTGNPQFSEPERGDGAMSTTFLQNLSSINEENLHGNLALNMRVLSPSEAHGSNQITNQSRWFGDFPSVSQNHDYLEGFGVNMGNSNSIEWKTKSTSNIQTLSPIGGQDLSQANDGNQRSGETLSVLQNHYNLRRFLSPIRKKNPHRIANQNRYFGETLSLPQNYNNLDGFGVNMRNFNSISCSPNPRILSARGEQNPHLTSNQNQCFGEALSVPQNDQNFDGLEGNTKNSNSITSSFNISILSPREEQDQHLITNQNQRFDQLSSAPQNYQNFEGFDANLSNFNSILSSPNPRILSPRGEQNPHLITNQNQRFSGSFSAPQINQNLGDCRDNMGNSKSITFRTKNRILSPRRERNQHQITNQNQRFGETLSVPQNEQSFEGFEGNTKNSNSITSSFNIRILSPREEQNQHLTPNQNQRFGELSSNTHILSPMEEQGSNQTRSQDGYFGEISSISQNHEKLECFGVNMDNSKSIACEAKSSFNTRILSPMEKQLSQQIGDQNGYFGGILSVSQNYENFVDFGVNMNNSKSIAWKTTTTSTTYIQTTPINKEQSQNLTTNQSQCFEILSASQNYNLEENLGNSSLIAWLTKSTSDINLVSPIEDQNQLNSENPCFTRIFSASKDCKNLGDNLVLSNSMALKTKSTSNIPVLPVIEGRDQITGQNTCFGETRGNREKPIRAFEPPELPKPNVIIRSIHVFNKDEKLTRIQQFDPNRGKLVEIEGFNSLESGSPEQDVIPASPGIFRQVQRQFKGGFSGHHHESIPSMMDHEGPKQSLQNFEGKDFQADLKNPRDPGTKSNLTVEKSLSKYGKFKLQQDTSNLEEIKAPAPSTNVLEENLNSYEISFGSNTQGSFLASSKESLKRDVSLKGVDRSVSKMLMKFSGHQIPLDAGKSDENRLRFSGVGNSEGRRSTQSVNDGKSHGGDLQGFANDPFAIQAEKDAIRILEDVEEPELEAGQNSHQECPIDRNAPIMDFGKDIEGKSFDSTCTTLKLHHSRQNSFESTVSMSKGHFHSRGPRKISHDSSIGENRIKSKDLEDGQNSKVRTFTSTASLTRFKPQSVDVPRRNDDEADSNVTITVEEPENDFFHVINQPSKFLKRYFEDNHRSQIEDHKLLDPTSPSQNDEVTQHMSKSIFEASGGSESLFSTPEAFFSAVDTTPVSETIEIRPEPKPLVRKRKFKTPLKQAGNPPDREAPPKRKVRAIKPSLSAKFVPPKIPSKREILKSFAEQKKEILDNSKDPDRVDKYMRFLENKPTVEQIQSQQYLAKIQRTGDGFVVIPASKPAVQRKKVIPLRRKLSSTEYDKTMFSDKNAKKLKCLLETEENIFAFAAEDSVHDENRDAGENPGFSLNFSQPTTSNLFGSNQHGV